jgi:CO/xanthine dehydrogenase FAD-binding subunit
LEAAELAPWRLSMKKRVYSWKIFFVGPGQTVLAERDLLTAIQVPPTAQASQGVYRKHAYRGSIDLAIVGVAAILTIEKEVCRDVKLVLGAVAPTPMRSKRQKKYYWETPLMIPRSKKPLRSPLKKPNPFRM